MDRKEKATELAGEYKRIEAEFPSASPERRNSLRTRIAEIASEMLALGYSLPQLIKKRQEREKL